MVRLVPTNAVIESNGRVAATENIHCLQRLRIHLLQPGSLRAFDCFQQKLRQAALEAVDEFEVDLVLYARQTTDLRLSQAKLVEGE